MLSVVKAWKFKQIQKAEAATNPRMMRIASPWRHQTRKSHLVERGKQIWNHIKKSLRRTSKTG